MVCTNKTILRMQWWSAFTMWSLWYKPNKMKPILKAEQVMRIMFKVLWSTKFSVGTACPSVLNSINATSSVANSMCQNMHML